VPGRPPAFDLVVDSEGGSRVWRRLEGKVVAMALGVLRLEPGEEIILSETWDQRTDDGVPVSEGAYRVRGVLPLEGGSLTTTPARLRIEAGEDTRGGSRDS
jgi:hypothetical protein